MPGFAAVVSCGRDKIIKIAFQLCQGCPKLFPATIAGVYDLFVPAIGFPKMEAVSAYIHWQAA